MPSETSTADARRASTPRTTPRTGPARRAGADACAPGEATISVAGCRPSPDVPPRCARPRAPAPRSRSDVVARRTGPGGARSAKLKPSWTASGSRPPTPPPGRELRRKARGSRCRDLNTSGARATTPRISVRQTVLIAQHTRQLPAVGSFFHTCVSLPTSTSFSVFPARACRNDVRRPRWAVVV